MLLDGVVQHAQAFEVCLDDLGELVSDVAIGVKR